MGDLVSMTGQNVTASSASIEQLKTALSDRIEVTFGTGDDPSPYGAETRAVWSLPDRITEDMLDAALGRQQMLMETLEPAGAERVSRWLVKLGAVCAASISEEAAQAKVNALCMLLDDAPAGAFTKGSYRRAVEQFKFFPAGQELLKFVEVETGRIKTELSRLGMILNAGVRNETPAPRWSKEAADAHREKLRLRKEQENRELAQAIKEREASASAVGSMKPLALSIPKIGKE